MKRTIASVLVAIMTILCIGGGYSESDALNDGIEAEEIILDQLPEPEQESEEDMATGDKLVNLDDLKVTYDKQQEDTNSLKSALTLQTGIIGNADKENDITGLLSIQGGISSDGSLDSNSGFLRTNYIRIIKGWKIVYKLRGTESRYVLAFYNNAYAVQSGIYGAAAGAYVTGTFTAPSDGYIACASTNSQSTGLADARIKIQSTLYEKLNEMEGDIATESQVRESQIEELTEKIKFINPITISGKYITSNGTIGESGTRYITDYIPCTAGLSVKYKGETNRTDISALTFYNKAKEPIGTNVNVGAINTLYTTVSPANTAYAVLSWSATASGFISINGSVFAAINSIKDDISNLQSNISNLEDDIDDVEENAVFSDELFYHKNMINPEEISVSLRYGKSAGKIIIADETYGGTGMIPVEEGETYTFSGESAVNVGGYFGQGAQMVNNQQALADISFVLTVTEDGYMFVVPTGLGIKYVSLVLDKTNGAITAGTYQLERGEIATDIVPYSKLFIKEEYLPNTNAEELTSFDALPIPKYDSLLIEPIKNFREHWAKKDKDIMVVGTGTSLTARGSEHCTLRTDATSRPPLLDSNNFASLMWDKMRWEGQFYRRYDYSGFFTETGTFLTSATLEDWDDATYRKSWTRYSNGACAVQYTIPSDAWQANFIYRTDTSGSEQVTVSVSGGNGKMLVWNGTEWVEANGYTFSMKETPVVLPSVSVPDPRDYEDNRDITIANYQVSGNTTFQKRLKMKAVSRDAEKTITISSSSGRFMYWGIEWSVREFMITYVNSARGSHNMTVDSERALQKYQDNEIWSFKPDLIFTENPIHNSGGSGQNSGFSQYYSNYWHNVTYDFFFNTSNPVSLVSRATANGINVANLEWVIFNASVSINFGGIDDDGLLKIQPDKNGRMITALDAQMMSQDYISSTGKAVSINACKYWVDAAFKLFGDLKTATTGSGKDGNTFTNEGSHWNDTGCKVMARCIGGVFDFYN